MISIQDLSSIFDTLGSKEVFLNSNPKIMIINLRSPTRGSRSGIKNLKFFGFRHGLAVLIELETMEQQIEPKIKRIGSDPS